QSRHFEIRALIVDARLPLHDLVAPRVDCAEAAARRARREHGVGNTARAFHRAAIFWSAGERLPERLDRLQRGTDLIVYSRPAAANRRAKRDHLAHDRGISRRDCASKDAAEAVPDDCDAL